jgi:hypothetical protein
MPIHLQSSNACVTPKLSTNCRDRTQPGASCQDKFFRPDTLGASRSSAAQMFHKLPEPDPTTTTHDRLLAPQAHPCHLPPRNPMTLKAIHPLSFFSTPFGQNVAQITFYLDEVQKIQ